MAKSSATPLKNRLLASLPRRAFERLLPRLQSVALKFKQELSGVSSKIDWVYFPDQGVVSEVTVQADGKNIEVATIGNEGFVGLPAILGGTQWPNRMVCQVPGEARRMEAGAFMAEVKIDGPLRELLARYHAAYIKQISTAVACNGLHLAPQRCCRWLLMTHDRVAGDEFPMTHEFLSQMLGVRRVTVTEVLKPLQADGLIRNHRGTIAVLDRKGLEAASCECYRNLQREFARLLG